MQSSRSLRSVAVLLTIVIIAGAVSGMSPVIADIASADPYIDQIAEAADLDVPGPVFRPAVATCQAADETFPTITPHDLRHTAASLAVSAHANAKAVQRMLGHAKASMTLDIYADLSDEDLDGVADRLDSAIRSTADQLRTGRSRAK